MADRPPATEWHARYALRRGGHDVPYDVRYERLLAGQTKVFDSFHFAHGHEVNRYILPDGGEVLATWCPDLKVVWWRPHGEEVPRA